MVVKKAHIFAKGPTFTDITVPDDEIKVCVNHTCLHVQNPDIAVFNDIEPLQTVYKNLNKNCVIYIPVYPHYKMEPSQHYTKYEFLKELNIKTFNLSTKRINDPSLIDIPIAISSVHTAIQLVHKLYNSIEEIHTYGFCKGDGYHPLFQKIKIKKGIHPGRRDGDKLVNEKGNITKIVDKPIIIH